MVLKPDDFTEQAQEVIGRSQEIVRRYSHAQWDVEHMLFALLEREEGVPAEILRKLEVSVTKMKDRLNELLEQGPKVEYQSNQIFVSPRAAAALERAKQEAERLNDDFITSEHLLVAIVQEDGGDAATVLSEFGIELEKVYQALQGIRGGHRATDARAGLSDPNRPIGSFIFLGPTGVGKTELARALAQYLFDDEQNMVRIDMSEYQEKHAVSRLVGAPPGYVGYEEGGQLTEAVRRRPFRVVLFDEVEKAHPDAFNMLLQILEDGRLTDGQGKTVDFRNTLIIMTSNLGTSEGSKEPLGFLRQAAEDSSVRMRSSVEDALKSTFRPEFLNRIDEIIVFEALTAEQIHGIADLMIEEVRNRVAERQVSITLTEAAREWLASEGFDPVYGARPLRRAIQRFVENPLSKRILASELSEGDEVLIDANEDGLTFEKIGEAVAVS